MDVHPTKKVSIGIDPYPYGKSCKAGEIWHDSAKCWIFNGVQEDSVVLTQEMQLSFGNLSHSYDADGPCVDGLSHQNVCFSPELVMIVNDLYQRVPSSTEVRGCQFRDVTSQVIGHPSYKMDEF